MAGAISNVSRVQVQVPIFLLLMNIVLCQEHLKYVDKFSIEIK